MTDIAQLDVVLDSLGLVAIDFLKSASSCCCLLEDILMCWQSALGAYYASYEYLSNRMLLVIIGREERNSKQRPLRIDTSICSKNCNRQDKDVDKKKIEIVAALVNTLVG